MSFENTIIFSQYVRYKLKSIISIIDHNDIYQEANRLGIKDKAIYIITDLVFTENILEEITLYSKLFLKFCYKNNKAQLHLIRALENLLSKNEWMYVRSISILKQFYDEGILDQETIIDNFDKYHHGKVASFVHLLIEASSESSESD